jgi:hypothetical protein
VRGRPQADNPAQQGSKAGRDVPFTALGACFVGSVFVELAEALSAGVLRLSEQERGVGGDGGYTNCAAKVRECTGLESPLTPTLSPLDKGGEGREWGDSARAGICELWLGDWY